jgi:diguanylate cyclase (GGDEF)-like protein
MRFDSASGRVSLVAEAVRTAGLIGLVVAIGIVDYLSGPDYGFALFYLMPVIAAAWLVTRRVAVIVGVVSAVAWVAADVAQQGVEHLGPSAWNGFTRLVFFVGAALLVSYWRQTRAELERLASQAIGEREEARRRAVTDPLTGLYNRNHLDDDAARIHSRARRAGAPYSVIVLDVDELKMVNDTSGHRAGDRALKRIADLIRGGVRRWDVAIRAGGDEFVILLPEAGPGEAADIAARLVAMRKSGPSFSVGVATWERQGTFEQVLALADRRMYEAKATRNVRPRSAPRRAARAAG